MRLKREQNAISPQDNFAKWAKIGRNYDKVEAQYNTKCTLQPPVPSVVAFTAPYSTKMDGKLD